MSKRGNELLTDAKIRAAKPKDKPYSLRDGRGLWLYVMPSGSRLWRLRYGHGRTESMVSLGGYPDIGLKKAREKAADLRGGLHQAGITPAAARKREKAERASTFEAVAREWVAKQNFAPATAAKIEWLTGLLFPHLGSHPVATIEAPDILQVLQRIEARGKHETAHRARGFVGRVMRYAIATGRAKRDPAADLRDALAPVVVEHHASITEPGAVGELLRAIDGYRGRGLPVTMAALKLAPLVFVRPGELRAAEWKEFTLEGESPEWRIPAERMKMREQHIVPLATQAVAILREIHQHTGHGKYVFPSERTRERPMSENAITAALRRMGFKNDEMTGHGFRSMASTLLNEQNFPPDVIELQLAHKERNKVRDAYNKAQRLPERRQMMQAWASYLDGLRAGGNNVVAINSAARA